jgi:hypothetical protein
MSAIRVPLLCAFAGGCLGGAVVLGFWRAEVGAAVPAPKPSVGKPQLVVASIAPNAPQPSREIAADVARAPSPAAPDPIPPVEAEAAAPAGSAVSDVLMDLEAAYRQHLAKSASAAPAAAEPVPSPTPTSTTIANAERPHLVPAQQAQVAPAVPVSPPSATTAAVNTPAATTPAATTPVAVAALAPQVAVPPEVAAAVDSRPARSHFGDSVHFGDINNNTYITNVRQGDVYLMQQQIAMMQYVQLLGLAAGQVGRAPVVRGAVAPQAPQYRQFPSTLTNPDNPWGFNFAPPNLVR